MIELQPVIKQQSHKKEYRRFAKQFIGISHELEKKRKQRRKIQLDERSMANRVLFLEKEEIKAQKNLVKKRYLFVKLMQTVDRQNSEQQQKQRLRLEREQQIQRLKNENRFKNMLHKEIKEQMHSSLHHRNSMDYSRIKESVINGEKRKKQQKLQDLNLKRYNWETINLNKEKGKSRIDKYFKTKNKQHAATYRQKIGSQESKAEKKLQTIKQLQSIQQILRKRVQQSSMKVSKVDELISNVRKNVNSQRSSRVSLDGAEIKPYLKLNKSKKDLMSNGDFLTSIEGQLLSEQKMSEKKQSWTSRNMHSDQDQVQENIELSGDHNDQSKHSLVRKRRKNKHKNRYRQYEEF